VRLAKMEFLIWGLKDRKASRALLGTTELLAKMAKMATPADLVFQARMASPEPLATLVIYFLLSFMTYIDFGVKYYQSNLCMHLRCPWSKWRSG